MPAEAAKINKPIFLSSIWALGWAMSNATKDPNISGNARKSSEMFLVRPIGKYGHTYLLTPARYVLYAALFLSSFVLLLAAGVLEIGFEKLYQQAWGWPIHAPSQYGFVIATITAFAAVGVAHRGQLADQEALSVLHRSDIVATIITSALDFNRFLMRGFGIVMSTLLVLSIIVSTIAGKPIPPFIFATTVFFTFFTWLLFRKRPK